MSDVQKLLDEATPLPWNVDGWHIFVGAGMSKRDILQAFKDEDARLARYAVNRLPDYEAAVSALEAVLPFVGMSLSISGHDVECTLNPCSCGVIEKHNAAVDALARLRETVPSNV